VFSGCQFSLYPMEQQFIPIILDAISPLQADPSIRIETDDISTFIAGPCPRLFNALCTSFRIACERGRHVVMNFTLSRGCPGEPEDPICHPNGNGDSNLPLPTAPTIVSRLTIAAQCALYPLGSPDYMESIYQEIEYFKTSAPAKALNVQGKHFCTRLDGPLEQVFHSLETAFVRACRRHGHVVLTATLSKGSPSKHTNQAIKII
jgi:energy-coupling factor transport system substrate-specific component